MWGVHVDTGKDLVSLPAGKVLKAQLVLADPLLDHGVDRIPLNLIQKLRGKWNFGPPAVNTSAQNARRLADYCLRNTVSLFIRGVLLKSNQPSSSFGDPLNSYALFLGPRRT